MKSWMLVYDGFDPEKEALREALCTLGNGYFATRGASAQCEAGGAHYPGTYLSGGYNRLETEIAGRVVENEDLVNLPNWLPLDFRVNGGDWFRVERVEVLEYRQELDLKRGVLGRSVLFQDEGGRRTRMQERRLVHMGDPHLAAIELTLKAENWPGEMEIRSALDGRVVNAGVKRYSDLNNRHLEPLEASAVAEDIVRLKVQTRQSELRIAQAARTRVFTDQGPIAAGKEPDREEGYIAQRFRFSLAEGAEAKVEKVLALYTSRDKACAECGLEAAKRVQRAKGFEDLLRGHAMSWEHLWERFEMQFELKEGRNDYAGMIHHLNIFHLLQTSSMHTINLDVGVPSRGWHGEAYRGHIFWDELFIFPFLNLRVPEITRSLLMYRFRRLPEARAAARAEGYRGAMFPWQSGSNGREESQRVHLNPRSGRWIRDNSRLQRHVNAAIAYNICQYYQATGDMEFISFYGARMLLEIARFWASIAAYNDDLDRYEILGVMGPDEYHDDFPGSENPGLDNNAYTNVMAVWVLVEALKVLDLLPAERREELVRELDLQKGEIEHWKEVSRKMRVVFHGDGIISQFEGYDRLKEFDWEGYRQKYGDIQRLDRILEAEEDSPNHYKVSKQADVLMLFYLFSAEQLQRLFERLGYRFDPELIPRNIDYYLKRTSHGSTLSRVVHSWVLARSDRARSWALCMRALESDLTDIQGGTTPEGIHLGAMAGSVNIIQECYTGLEPRDEVLWFNPCLPDALNRLRMEIRYHGYCLDVEVTQERFTVSTGPCVEGPIRIGFDDQVYEMKAEETKSFRLN